MNIRDFAPPIAVRTAKRIYTRLKPPPIYTSYADAMKACNEGYEDTRLIDVIFEKTKIYRDQLFSKGVYVCDTTSPLVLFGAALSAIGQHDVRVLDFGGSCGAHYFLVKAILGSKIRFQWHVVETAATVRKAHALETDELKFFDDLTEAVQRLEYIDLMHSSGTLQCVPAPYDTLQELIKCNSKMLLLRRLAFTLGNFDLVTIHETPISSNGPGPLPPGMPNGVIRYPFQFIQRSRFEAIVNSKYNILAQFNDDTGIFQIGKDPLVGGAYLGERKK